jgi:heme exporter protein D
MSDQTERKMVRWTMWGVLVVVLLHFASSLVQHGKLMQKVTDLEGRVARIEAWIDADTKRK